MRAAVVIGVDQAGGLPLLAGAASDAARVEEWLRKEGYATALLTDTFEGERGKGVVTLDAVKKAIKEYDPSFKTDRKERVEQLVVYFAGHGLNNFDTEIWLLSGTPVDANEAINLGESVDLARDRGIDNVVFISDACRSTPPPGPLRRIRGGVIFPNTPPPPGRARGKVDRLLPTVPNAAAYEVSEPIAETVGRAGIFTSELLRAHGVPAGQAPPGVNPERELVRNASIASATVRVVDLILLAQYLEQWVPNAATARGVRWPQQPECIVETPPANKYLGRAMFPPTDPFGTPVGRNDEDHDAWPSEDHDALPSLAEMLEDRVDLDVRNTQATILASDSAVDHFETGSGVQVSGATIAWAKGCDAKVLTTWPPYNRVQLNGKEDHRWSAGSVLIKFAEGNGTVVAGLRGYIASISVQNGRVANVSYLPSQNSRRWRNAQDRYAELMGLRALIAAQVKHGVFRVRGEDAIELGHRIRVLKAIDPTLGLYAAYAYHDAGGIDEIRGLLSYMRADLAGRPPLDVALLAQSRAGSQSSAMAAAVPFCPMLMRGWPMFLADPTVPAVLREAAGQLVPALWTTFDDEGLGLLADAMDEGLLS